MLMDLNADVGEGCGDDAALMPLLTSASIACGAHAGDAASMRRTVALALKHGVVVGAHVAYPDRAHFGRRDLTLPSAKLTAEILHQLKALSDIAEACGTRMRYVKAHGALYNRMAEDEATAAAVIAAVRSFDSTLPVLTLPGSTAETTAHRLGTKTVAEAFADRAYTADGRLVSRDQAGAVITDENTVVQRAVDIACTHCVQSIDGRSVHLHARSLCVHGDTPGAVRLARALRTALEQVGVQLRAFA
ncbi:MAG TPA: 5-oxoprolinase subunit PxpA [Gammaproteobacteria bacterium]|nr:5-oxoprolinase subunit PxpA [Gammaproteobacteria bacterium]